jgi:phosphoglycerol transferase MdoB-like AlkP superfamily enzyme
MGFDNFTNSIGFENYYGRNEYDNDDDFDGKWGIFDHKFFDFFEKSLNEKKQPFLAAIFSLSAHHPYTLPIGFENKFPRGKIPIQQCIAYSDYSLMQFFMKAKYEKWYENTLFIITADHTSEISDSEFNNSTGRYSIPIVYYMPNDSLLGEYSNTTQQLDIMPSVLDYLNYEYKFYSLGNSIFNKHNVFFEAISYNSGVYQYICGDSIYYFIEGSQLIESEINPFYEFNKTEKYETNYQNRFKALIQEYNKDIIDNKMN